MQLLLPALALPLPVVLAAVFRGQVRAVPVSRLLQSLEKLVQIACIGGVTSGYYELHRSETKSDASWSHALMKL